MDNTLNAHTLVSARIIKYLAPQYWPEEQAEEHSGAALLPLSLPQEPHGADEMG